MANAGELEKISIEGNFDTEHYKDIHKYLFQELYDWAGQFRTVNISKKGTRFADVMEIEDLCNNCFKRLKDCNYFQNMSFDDFVENIVDLYCTLNYIHPFREGNGRTQRIFLTQLIRKNGYNINFSEIDPDYLIIATIQSAQGINDNLTELFKKSIIKE